ncbi:MAG: hypothetical protein A3G20_09000 [Acidobacteria bacterium RIFCSPLOWO2_12_FULL_59_11]|nr:MAG: hypothetical protein A3G20_09000 [Acidobacteria bacterium RIFCSPLOWO2_12_FULL_59_11]
MLYEIVTKRTPQQAGQALEAAAQKHKFGVMAVHNLQETMAKKGVEFAKECLIYEVCNPLQAKKVLEANLSISTALPCRIAVFQEGDQTKLSTLKPTAMLALFGNRELDPVAQEVEQVIIAMMNEAAGE